MERIILRMKAAKNVTTQPIIEGLPPPNKVTGAVPLSEVYARCSSQTAPVCRVVRERHGLIIDNYK